VLRAAESHYAAQARLSAASAVLAGQAWDRVPVGRLDLFNAGRLAVGITALQVLAVRQSDAYVDAALAEQGIDSTPAAEVSVKAIAGVAGDGRDLTSLLDLPRIEAKTAIGGGLAADLAWDRARESLRLMAVTAVQDAGRAGDSVAMVARPQVGGYVRMLNPPSCPNCAVLAGKFYKWNTGFARHPRCDCRHVPSNEDVAGDLRTDPLAAIRSGQVRGLSKADTRAILEDGADVGQVINAHRGMYTADAYGQRVKATQEGVTRRGVAGRRMAEQGGRYTKTPRLRPEAIYRVAADREDAIRLLKRFGYLT
jgi:hypothetical protein